MLVVQKYDATVVTKVNYFCQNSSVYSPCIIESCINDEFGNLDVKDMCFDSLQGTGDNVCFDADGPLIENSGLDPVFTAFEQNITMVPEIIPSMVIHDDVPYSTLWD
uniref:Uncharacterized protein n=1 Tax=Ditylum brightwellii TaxID=49249 RepID=A0A7S4RVM4_9STRA